MSRVRVYLPATLPDLSARLALDPVTGDVVDTRVDVADAGAIGFAVTPGLREWYREGDLEELEYVALTHAARASLRLLAHAGAGRGEARRVVLAVDVPDAAVRPAAEVDVAAVRLSAPASFADLAAIHVDDLIAADDVAAAAAVLDAAESGDEDARFAVEGLDDHELQWYAVQEIEFLLG